MLLKGNHVNEFEWCLTVSKLSISYKIIPEVIICQFDLVCKVTFFEELLNIVMYSSTIFNFTTFCFMKKVKGFAFQFFYVIDYYIPKVYFLDFSHQLVERHGEVCKRDRVFFLIWFFCLCLLGSLLFLVFLHVCSVCTDYTLAGSRLIGMFPWMSDSSKRICDILIV